MTKPPHSGCGCESGNNLPCEHNECSYCSLLRQRQDDLLAAEDRRSKMEAKRMLMEQIKKEVEAEAARQKAAASGMDAARRAVLYGEPKSEMDETTTITRAALEGLCAQAGIEMDWNGGQPIIRKGTLVPGGSLTERAVNSLTANAVASMDTLVGKKLKETIRETLRGDLVENEATIIRKAKNDGVTDDDISAVTGEGEHHLPTQAAAATRDEGDLSRQIDVHQCPP